MSNSTSAARSLSPLGKNVPNLYCQNNSFRRSENTFSAPSMIFILTSNFPLWPALKIIIIIIIDPSCPFDSRIFVKEEEKLSNYEELKYELARIWIMKKVTIVPIVIGALGTVTEKIDSWLEQIGIDCPVALLQKGCLLGSARMIRKVMNS